MVMTNTVHITTKSFVSIYIYRCFKDDKMVPRTFIEIGLTMNVDLEILNKNTGWVNILFLYTEKSSLDVFTLSTMFLETLIVTVLVTVNG